MRTTLVKFFAKAMAGALLSCLLSQSATAADVAVGGSIGSEATSGNSRLCDTTARSGGAPFSPALGSFVSWYSKYTK